MRSRSVLLIGTLLVGGCPSGLDLPTAVIAEGSSADAESALDQCQEASRIEARVGEAAALHAGCSRDPNGLTLHYRWSLVDQPAGSAIRIVNDEAITPTIIPDREGRYRIGLVVFDGTLSSERAEVTLEATPE